ncbi:MAG TPA: UDP-N-acetylmuramate dehydrogenase [Alphaproteobacteria bacterium]|nr:UDP-N-acetylmuramate dehydrogenase [Alphaproteobacteria bacterium]
MNDLLDRFPAVRGRLRRGVPLAPTSWFKVGGPADLLFRPEDAEDLRTLLSGRPKDMPVTVLGVSSNTLIRDGGIRGLVIKLGRGFTDVAPSGEDGLIAGGGGLCATVSQQAQGLGLGGLAFLSGIPGTLGGALRMNAGAYGGEVAEIVDWAEAVDPDGGLHRLGQTELGYAYRHSAVAEDWIFVRARLRGEPGAADIAEKMADIAKARAESQPLGTATGGSTFRNPPGLKAWQLIDAAGCRGLRVGGAVMSDKHCNFMINDGGATAADLEILGEAVRERVRETSGVTLQWEIRRLGEPLPEQQSQASTEAEA